MNGEIVKKILLDNGYKLKDIALAMNKSPQNLHSLLKTKDIKIEVLERIALTINKNLNFFLYKGEDFKNSRSQLINKNKSPKEDQIFKISSTVDAIDDYFKYEKKIKELEWELKYVIKERDSLKREIESKNKIIELMENKLGGVARG